MQYSQKTSRHTPSPPNGHDRLRRHAPPSPVSIVRAGSRTSTVVSLFFSESLRPLAPKKVFDSFFATRIRSATCIALNYPKLDRSGLRTDFGVSPLHQNRLHWNIRIIGIWFIVSWLQYSVVCAFPFQSQNSCVIVSCMHELLIACVAPSRGCIGQK